MKYFEIIKEGISICLDSDINYYHHFEVGEILCISNYFNPTLEYIINKDSKWKTCHKFEYFVREWSSTNSQNWTIPSCIYQGYFKDVTEGVVLSRVRERKLKEIGI